MPDSSVRLANLRPGSIDIVEQIVPTDVEAVQDDPKLRIVMADALGYQGITNNTDNGPRAKTPYGQDARVRQAFELSIDRDAMLQVVYNGMFPATAQPIPAASPYHVDLPPTKRDVARAKALLKEAGVKTPVTLKLTVPNSPDVVQVAEVIQSMAAEAGFDVKIRAMEAGRRSMRWWRATSRPGSWTWSGRPDPDGNMYSFLHTGGPFNEGHYSNPAIDALLDQGRAASGVAERRAIYTKLMTQEAADLPVTYLWGWRNIAGMSAQVTGFRSIPDGLVRLQGLGSATDLPERRPSDAPPQLPRYLRRLTCPSGRRARADRHHAALHSPDRSRLSSIRTGPPPMSRRNHGYLVFDTLYGQDGSLQHLAADARGPCDRKRRQALEAHPARRPALA